MDYAPDLAFLERLLLATGPSGFEEEAAQVFLEKASTFAEAEKDRHGNVYARLNPGQRPKVLLMGHLDEIGVIVSHVEEKGFLRLRPLGGWDPRCWWASACAFWGRRGRSSGWWAGRPSTS
jgi:putative aminopeptidase FrvX